MSMSIIKKPIAHGLFVGCIICMSFAMTGCSSSTGSTETTDTTSVTETAEVTDTTGSTETTVTMEDMMAAGEFQSLLSNHDSVMITASYHLDGDTAINYVDEEMSYQAVSNSNTAYLYIDGKFSYMFCDDVYAGVIFLDEELEEEETVSNLFYNERSDEETIVSMEESDGNLYVTTEMSAELTEAILAEDGFTSDEGDTMRVEYVLDVETLEILSFEEIVIAEDGTETAYMSAETSFDVERPEEATTLYEHANATEDVRTVTLIVNPDTEEEEIFTKQVQKGDAVQMEYPEDYDGPYTDRACTEELSSANREEDVTVYFKSAS